MPRPSKRDQLLRAASELFIRNGFHATGIDRIVEEAGVARMTLYKHFKSKDDLIVAVLEKRDLDFRSWFVKRVDEMASDAFGKILASFDALGEWFAGKGLNNEEFHGCAFVKAASEYCEANAPAHKVVEAHNEVLHQYFTDLTSQIGVRNPSQLADEIMLLQSGAILAAQVSRDPAVAQQARKAAERLTHSMM